MNKALRTDQGFWSLFQHYKQNLVAILILTLMVGNIFGNSRLTLTVHAEEAGEEAVIETILNAEETSDGDISDEETGTTDAEIIPTGYTFEGENYRIEVVIESYWQNYYNAKLMITNTSHDIIHNWGMSFASADAITNLYNAEEILSEDGVYLLKNVGWNQDILPSQTIVIGYMAQYENAPNVAHNFVFPMAENTVENEDYSIYFNILQSWDTGANVELIIENHTEENIEDWALDFSFAHTITNIWNAEIISQEGDSYQLHASDYAANILPGGSATVGMVINYAEAGFDVNTLSVSDVTLREINLAEGDGNGDNEDDASSGDNSSEDTESSEEDTESSEEDTESSEEDSEENVSDNDIMEGVVYLDTSVGGATPVEIYYKEIASAEDIIDSPDGLPCVRNQMLLMANDEITFEEVERYMAGIGAAIVGFVEITNDYQIEFICDKDVTELETYIEMLETESWVDVVGYNYLWLEEPEFCSTDPWEKTDSDVSWNSIHPEESNWGIEAIDLMGGLINAGVITDASCSANDIRTDHLTTVRMGIIDNAFNVWHEDLDDNFMGAVNNYASLEALQEAYASNAKLDHGTHVAGIMGAEFNNGTGITGICVENEIWGFGLRENRLFSGIVEDSNVKKHAFYVICGLEFLIHEDIKVINYSYGMPTAAFACTQIGTNAANDATQYLTEQSTYIAECLDSLLAEGYDFLIVTAAGNANNDIFYEYSEAEFGYISYETYNKDPQKYPGININDTYGSPLTSANNTQGGYVQASCNSVFNAISKNNICYDHIICVGSYEGMTYNSQGQMVEHMSSYACRGPRVDILAPGVDIYSCSIPSISSNGYVYKPGTSMAAPFVSGAIGLAYNVYPDISAIELKELIISSASNRNFSVNVLNVANLIQEVNILKQQNEMCEVQLHITDSTGNSISNASIEIRSRGIYYFVALGGMNAWEAAENNIFYSSDELVTDVSGNATCYLPEGHYYAVITEGENRGEAYHIWVQDTDLQNTVSHTIILQEYDNQTTDYLRFQVRYADGSGDVNDAHIILYEGWNQSSGAIVAEATITNPNRYTMGRVTFEVPEGCYTALVSDSAGNQTYCSVIVNGTVISYIVYL